MLASAIVLATRLVYIGGGGVKADETETRRSIERSSDEAKVRHEMELTTLTENLSTLRAEMSSTAQRHSELDRTVKTLQAEKLGLNY